jgi:hypothetical protein
VPEDSIVEKRMFLTEIRQLRYLSIIAGPRTSTEIAYIAFLTKLQKRQCPKMKFAFLIPKNTNSRFLAKKKDLLQYQKCG